MAQAKRIVVLSGAGMSAESGLSTFRDRDGIWAQVDIEEVATPAGFSRCPERVHDFYNARRQRLHKANPNEGHIALARLEKTHHLTIITQNVDDLHERAGSHNVLHMHGELKSALCAACGDRAPAPDILSVQDQCENCGESALRPDVVWFGEMPYFMDEIDELLTTADIFVAIGTSGQVSPANTFVLRAREGGAMTYELNLEPTTLSSLFHESRIGPATQLVPEWVAEISNG